MTVSNVVALLKLEILVDHNIMACKATSATSVSSNTATIAYKIVVIVSWITARLARDFSVPIVSLYRIALNVVASLRVGDAKRYQNVRHAVHLCVMTA